MTVKFWSNVSAILGSNHTMFVLVIFCERKEFSLEHTDQYSCRFCLHDSFILSLLWLGIYYYTHFLPQALVKFVTFPNTFNIQFTMAIFPTFTVSSRYIRIYMPVLALFFIKSCKSCQSLTAGIFTNTHSDFTD